MCLIDGLRTGSATKLHASILWLWTTKRLHAESKVALLDELFMNLLDAAIIRFFLCKRHRLPPGFDWVIAGYSQTPVTLPSPTRDGIDGNFVCTRIRESIYHTLIFDSIELMLLFHRTH